MIKSCARFSRNVCQVLIVSGACVLGAWAAEASSVTVEAESGVLGADWAVNSSGSPVFIAIGSNNTGGNPSSASRVATYEVVFPAAGTYELYARIRVGSAAFDDDSLFYGNGFGNKSPTSDGDWILVNGLASAGFTASGSTVAGVGSAGSQVWKWVNLSQFTNGVGETPRTFSVTPGNLEQTFQIGAREDGLAIDRLAFGTVETAFAVSNLDAGTLPPSVTLTNAFPGPDGMALHRFSPISNGVNADGANPAAGLSLVGGLLFGTTLNGGLHGEGTAFYVSDDGSNFLAFHAFGDAQDAGSPEADLLPEGGGFFGTSLTGGANGTGAVFVGGTNGTVAVLHSFAALDAHRGTNASGASPSGSLVLMGQALYGATAAGGAHGNGVIFSLNTNGTGFVVLHHFSPLDVQTGTNVDGAVPRGGLVLSGDTLYGTASLGGAGGNGVVFSIRTNGTGFTTLHSFGAMDVASGANADGALPCGGLVLSDNTLYGTASHGGHGGAGTVFSVGLDGSGFEVLYHFSKMDTARRTNADGALPAAGLVLSGNVLYGTAAAGGAGGAGTVFGLRLGGGPFTTLHSFSAAATDGTNADGACPVAPLLRLGDSLYGTAFTGGPGAAGTVFRLPLMMTPATAGIFRDTENTVVIHFRGAPDSTNVIQATTSLSPPVVWQDISTNIADPGGAWRITNSILPIPTQFYRSYAR